MNLCIFYFVCILQIFFTSFLQARLVVSEKPSTVISGEEALLERPEGVSFSPSGDCLAIANSSGGSVTIYARVGNEGTKYQSTPECIIKNRKLLVYPHDLDFSPCGNFLAVANRNKHSISFFRRTSNSSCQFKSATCFNLRGKRTKLNLPASVAYSPKGDFLVVANRLGGGPITLYRPKNNGNNSVFDFIPFNIITAEELQARNISASHGVAVSYDGKKVAAVHKRVSSLSPSNSALVIYENQASPNKAPCFAPTYVKDFGKNCLHSISFHPSGKYLLITHERDDVMIFEWSEESQEYEQIAAIPIEKSGKLEGAKGAAFSPRGNCLAVTTMTPEVLVYDIFEVDDSLIEE